MCFLPACCIWVFEAGELPMKIGLHGLENVHEVLLLWFQQWWRRHRVQIRSERWSAQNKKLSEVSSRLPLQSDALATHSRIYVLECSRVSHHLQKKCVCEMQLQTTCFWANLRQEVFYFGSSILTREGNVASLKHRPQHVDTRHQRSYSLHLMGTSLGTPVRLLVNTNIRVQMLCRWQRSDCVKLIGRQQKLK